MRVATERIRLDKIHDRAPHTHTHQLTGWSTYIAIHLYIDSFIHRSNLPSLPFPSPPFPHSSIVHRSRSSSTIKDPPQEFKKVDSSSSDYRRHHHWFMDFLESSTHSIHVRMPRDFGFAVRHWLSTKKKKGRRRSGRVGIPVYNQKINKKKEDKEREESTIVRLFYLFIYLFVVLL